MSRATQGVHIVKLKPSGKITDLVKVQKEVEEVVEEWINRKNYKLILLELNMVNEELIISRLDLLRKDVEFIKEHIVDVTLTQNDVDSLNEAEEDLRKGRTKRL